MYFSHMRNRPSVPIQSKFDTSSEVVGLYIIKCAKFYVDQLRGFGLAVTRISHVPI